MNLDIQYCSDKYQYTMGKSFFETERAGVRAVFNMFYRKAPEHNNWAVVSGVDEVLEMISALGNAPEGFFERFLPGENYAPFRKHLSSMKFTGNVYAMREGEIAFPGEPVITVEGPIIEAQVLETPLLCIMNHQMAVATKASRVCRATEKPVSEFGSRRAHGPWAATFGAKAAMIAGCANSSNVLNGVLNGVPSSGTMAHSYITSYGNSVEGEHRAFLDYIDTHIGENLILLVDTYDTLRCGVPNAIRAFKEKGIDDTYGFGYGIRLDSGDLAYLSIKAREALDAAGLRGCKISATNSLDEYLISDLERQGARIDFYGVGDAIATSREDPTFGNVYKLVQVDGLPVMKMSEDKAKMINPGLQITYRLSEFEAGTAPEGENNRIYKADLTCLRGDASEKTLLQGGEITVRSELERYKQRTFLAGKYTCEPLQRQVIKDGKTVEGVFESLPAKQAYYKTVLSRFSPSERRIINPHYYKVDISDELYDLKMATVSRLAQEIRDFEAGRGV